MFARLTSLNDQPNIVLADVVTVVGRQESCNGRICSSRVSRRHCCLVRDRDEVVVFDLRSSNGIRINGRRVEDGHLRPGDVLEIAHLGYRLDLLDDGEAGPSATRGRPGGGYADGSSFSMPTPPRRRDPGDERLRLAAGPRAVIEGRPARSDIFQPRHVSRRRAGAGPCGEEP